MQTAPASASSEELTLTTLTGQLTDASRSPKTRLEAAAMLLARGDAQATETLLGLLSPSDNPGAQIAIAEAIAAAPVEYPKFVDPLLAVLRQGDASVRRGRPGAGATAERRCDREAHCPGPRRLGRGGAAGRRDRGPVRRPDKRTVEAMVGLLDDPVAAIHSAAAESLAKLTNIRAFGDDSAQWKQWWKANRDKDRSAWLVDLTDSLARAKASLEADNTRLRERLTATISDLYDATPVTQRETLLGGLLKDSLADVRLAALRLVDRRLASNEMVSPELRGGSRGPGRRRSSRPPGRRDPGCQPL